MTSTFANGAVLVTAALVAILFVAFGAALFRAAVAMCNQCTGGQSPPLAVPTPSYPQSTLIVFVAGLFGVGLEIVMFVALGLAILWFGGVESGFALAIRDYAVFLHLFIAVMCLPVVAGMTKIVLSTTFTRGALVAICYGIATSIFSIVVACFHLFGSALLYLLK